MKIYRLVRGFARQMSRANVNAYAASTAFFIFLSLIPMIMLICSVLAVTPIVQKSDLLTAATIFPPSITRLIVGLIENIYDSTFGMISASAIVTVWSAGKGILALMRGLNAMNGVVEDRNYVVQRLIASFYLIIFLVMVVFSLVVMVFGNLLASVIVRHVPGMESLFPAASAFSRNFFLVRDDASVRPDVYLHSKLQAAIYLAASRRGLFRSDLERVFLGVFHLCQAFRRF